MNTRRRKKSPQMFVSLPRLIRNPNTNRVKQVELHLVTAGELGETTLVYETLAAAQAQRTVLQASANVCGVPSWKLWGAIRNALLSLPVE